MSFEQEMSCKRAAGPSTWRNSCGCPNPECTNFSESCPVQATWRRRMRRCCPWTCCSCCQRNGHSIFVSGTSRPTSTWLQTRWEQRCRWRSRCPTVGCSSYLQLPHSELGSMLHILFCHNSTATFWFQSFDWLKVVMWLLLASNQSALFQRCIVISTMLNFVCDIDSRYFEARLDETEFVLEAPSPALIAVSRSTMFMNLHISNQPQSLVGQGRMWKWSNQGSYSVCVL